MNNLRVLVADSRQLIREGLVASLLKTSCIQVVSQCTFGEEVIQLAADHKPDIILLGGNIIGLSCAEVTHRIKELYPEIRIIIVTALSRQYIDPLSILNAEAHGYMDIDIGLTYLIENINRVHEGGHVLSPLIAERLAENLKIWERKFRVQPEFDLSKREAEVLELVSQGLTNKQIAKTLFIAESTIKAHLHGILQKMKVQSRAQAAIIARDKRIDSVKSTSI